MPIYEYKCKNCRKVVQLMRSVSAYKDPVKCTCGKNAKLVIPKSSFILTDGDVKWLDSAKMTLPKDAEHIRTRGEHRRYLQDHGLVCVG